MMTLDQLCKELKERHAAEHSWRLAGAPYKLNPAMARLIANGYQPGKKIRELVGLPPAVSVVVIRGEVPPGSQAIAAEFCVECGKPYISNHPRRRKCFVCSPYRGK